MLLIVTDDRIALHDGGVQAAVVVTRLTNEACEVTRRTDDGFVEHIDHVRWAEVVSAALTAALVAGVPIRDTS